MSRRRNILLLQTDEHVYSMLGIMGDPAVRTPNLDALARDGATVFDNAYACNGVCVPSRACLMTGRYPIAHGVTMNEMSLPPSERTMGDFFSAAGYVTGFFGKTHFGRDDRNMAASGWQKSFLWHAQYNQYLADHGIAARYPEKSIPDSRLRYWTVGRSAIPYERYFEKVIADKAIEFIREERNQDFLCCVSFVAPHGPFTPPAPYDSMYAPADMRPFPRHEGELDGKPPAMVRWVRQNRRYVTDEEMRVYLAVCCGLISLVDEQVGRLVTALKEEGLYDDCLIVFTTDHGDFGSRYGILGKSWCTIEQIIRTPLIISVPGARGALRRTETLAENVDVLPTLMEFAGVPPSPRIQGKSLMPILTGAVPSVKDAAFAYGTFQYSGDKMSQSMIRRGDWKLVESSGFDGELYNLRDDPWELHNRIAEPGLQPLVAELRQRLLQWHVAHSGGTFDLETARFWEDETAFYDETVFRGERIVKRSERAV